MAVWQLARGCVARVSGGPVARGWRDTLNQYLLLMAALVVATRVAAGHSQHRQATDGQRCDSLWRAQGTSWSSTLAAVGQLAALDLVCRLHGRAETAQRVRVDGDGGDSERQ